MLIGMMMTMIDSTPQSHFIFHVVKKSLAGIIVIIITHFLLLARIAHIFLFHAVFCATIRHSVK